MISQEVDRSINSGERTDHTSISVTGIFYNTIKVDGIIINHNDTPQCMQILQEENDNEDDDEDEDEENDCENCEFFSTLDCLLRFDYEFAEEINLFLEIQLKTQVLYAQRIAEIASFTYNELLAHGRPLHHEVISRIVVGRYPELRITEKEVYQAITSNYELFERVDLGVYRARKTAVISDRDGTPSRSTNPGV